MSLREMHGNTEDGRYVWHAIEVQTNFGEFAWYATSRDNASMVRFPTLERTLAYLLEREPDTYTIDCTWGHGNRIFVHQTVPQNQAKLIAGRLEGLELL